MTPLPHSLDRFRQVWVIDCEFTPHVGDCPTPICLVAREVRSGTVLYCWEDELQRRTSAPFPMDADTLVVGYFLSAEWSCFLALDWSLPHHVLDLYAEFRNLTCGLPTPRQGYGLLGALVYFGLDAMDATEKDELRQLAIRGAPWTAEERAALLAYCEQDVDATVRLFLRMAPTLNVPMAVLRGRYTKAVGRMEAVGVPVDVGMLQRLVENWTHIKLALVPEYDHLGIYDRTVFKAARWAQWVEQQRYRWPRTKTGHLSLSDETFQEMAQRYPAVQPYRELRSLLSKLRLQKLTIGKDGRNRSLIRPFGGITGRNAPSTNEFVFGLPRWTRPLIRPTMGRVLSYLDWQSQEYAVAAYLSGDPAMIRAYETGDPYLATGQQLGHCPADATKTTHPEIRARFKIVSLAVNYGQGEKSLALRLGISETEAADLLRLHRRTYRRFWAWSDQIVVTAQFHQPLSTVFGWSWKPPWYEKVNPRTAQNWPVQSNAGEMLRLGCCLATEAGLKVCAPIHDALLVESTTDQAEADIAATREAMAKASRLVLGGFTVRVEVKTVPFPRQFEDEGGTGMWDRVQKLLG